MRVWLTMDMRNPDRRPWREHWEDCLWFLSQAEELGFHGVLVQEHFFTADGYAPSVPIFLTELIRRTERVRVGAWAYVLPLHNAAQLAQEIAVLDHLSNGRLEVVLAAGHSPSEYEVLGLEIKDRPSRMEEGLQVLQGCWTGEPFSYEGTHYSFTDLRVEPQPLQSPHPPLWVASTAVPSARRAGRYGADLAAATLDSAVFAAYREEWNKREAQDQERPRVSIALSPTVTFEDPEDVWRRNYQRYQERYAYYEDIRAGMGDEELNIGAAEATTDKFRENELIGEPEVILRTIRELEALTGCTDLVLTGPAAGIPLRTEAWESLGNFAHFVLPELNKM